MSSRQKLYAWTVLIIILLCNISNQWQRFIIATAYQIKAPTDEPPDPKYEMRYAIPNFTTEKYAYLAGATFTIFFATAVLFTGMLADNMSRKILLCLAAILWSFTSIGTSFCQYYWQLCIMRILLGLFEACIGPPAYSLITDFFPPEKRTLANSVYSFGIYIGASLSNITIIIIETIGWRLTYFIVGCFGILVGLVGLVVIMEPQRGKFEPKKLPIEKPDKTLDDVLDEIKQVPMEERANSVTASEMEEQELLGVISDRGPKMPVLTLTEPPKPKESIFSKYFGGCSAMFRNKCCLWLVLGGCCRFWQGYTLTYYSFSFFNLYKNDKLYGWMNALSVLVGGFTSSILAGIICDKFEPVNYRTKSYVIVTQSLLAVPICAIAFLSTSSFTISMLFLFLEYLLAEGWMPAVLSMLLTCIEV